MQAGLFVPRLAAAGNDVVVSAFWGVAGDIGTWEGHLVLPPGQDAYGSDVLHDHAAASHADAVITLMDAWVLDRGQVRLIREHLQVPFACWLPVDVQRLGEKDEAFIRETGIYPIAMSRHGQRCIQDKGLRCGYVPHGVDTAVFRPPADREALRAGMGFKDRFVVGVNAMNKDPLRKSFAEGMEAFRRFRVRHPEADPLLALHTWRAAPFPGLNLLRMAERKGIAAAITFPQQYMYTIGRITPPMLNDWYGAIDVLMAVSYGEGFGVPVIEAQAAGTPVIVNDAAAMTELRGPGWKVRGQPWWHDFHGEDWQVPFIGDIVQALERAYEEYRSGAAGKRRERARRFALRYDADLVTRKYWVPVLAELGAERDLLQRIGGDRDRAVARLCRAWADGKLGTDEFGARTGRALAAAVPGDLAPLVAGLGEQDAA